MKPLPGTGPAGHLATISSELVFESFADAIYHLDAVLVHLEREYVTVTVEPIPVLAHVPGIMPPPHPIGYRLGSRCHAATEAIAQQVAALRAAGCMVDMTGTETVADFSV